MAIIVSKGTGKGQRVKASAFSDEAKIQAYIHDNPESIPLDEIDEDIRLLTVAREVRTESGPIDVVGIDSQGNVYLIETKLFKNPDKRKIIAQVLDYGAALWSARNPVDEFIRVVDEQVMKAHGVTLSEKTREFFELSDEGNLDLIRNIRRNVGEGIFRFVILLDVVDRRLKDLVRYLNQNSQFDIYAVEMKRYQHEGYEIIVPRLTGAEVRKEPDSRAGGTRRHWDKASVLQDFRDKLADRAEVLERIYAFAVESADRVTFGTGSYGSFSVFFDRLSVKSLFTVSADGRLSFNFEWVGRDNPDTVEELKRRIEELGFAVPRDFRRLRPGYPLEIWGPKAGAFIEMMKRWVGEGDSPVR